MMDLVYSLGVLQLRGYEIAMLLKRWSKSRQLKLSEIIHGRR
jgi:hypothetical protein